jgi:hypothetical protein
VELFLYEYLLWKQRNFQTAQKMKNKVLDLEYKK